MFNSDVNSIRTQMNAFGKDGKPFLFAVNFEMTEGLFVADPLNQSAIQFQIKGVGNKKIGNTKVGGFYFHSTPIAYEDYKQKFDVVHKGLKQGNSFLTNLTAKTAIDTNLAMSDIFSHSHSPYQLYLPDRFVCFSPERFVKIENGLIWSNPMKGTIDANIADAENKILNDFKETAEHNTIVDLIRNDLSMVSNKVGVERFRYIDRIKTNNKTILQVSSEIVGQLPNNYLCNLGDIIFKLLPAGSVCGAPKDATLELIQQAEQEPRGYYTGVFGYFDGQKLDTAVLIRFIEMQDDKLYFRSGGGITAYSNAEDEYTEVLNKVYLPFV